MSGKELLEGFQLRQAVPSVLLCTRKEAYRNQQPAEIKYRSQPPFHILFYQVLLSKNYCKSNPFPTITAKGEG